MKKKISLTLKENGIHSLEKGLSVFKEYEQSEDPFLLKEAIMFLHHGIELLMKQTLVENSGEFLIFSDIEKDTIKKVIQARKENISVFNLPKPIHTATYEQVVDRVDAFVNDHLLPESLKTWLVELNGLRNQIEHYAIDKEVDIIRNLIVKIRKPLLSFFEKSIKDFKKTESKKVSDEWTQVSEQITVENEIIEGIQLDKLIVVCEGKTDAIVLNILINKVFTQYNIYKPYYIIVANGLPYLSKKVRNIIAHSGGDKILVVTDGDGRYNEREQQMIKIGVPQINQIIIEPEIEAWLFNNSDKLSDRKQIKEAISLKGGYEKVAESIEIDELRKRDKSFEKLLNVLTR